MKTVYTTSQHCAEEMAEQDMHGMKTMSNLKDPIQTSSDKALDTKQTEDLYLKYDWEILQIRA